jgi:hypothetical protein
MSQEKTAGAKCLSAGLGTPSKGRASRLRANLRVKERINEKHINAGLPLLKELARLVSGPERLRPRRFRHIAPIPPWPGRGCLASMKHHRQPAPIFL